MGKGLLHTVVETPEYLRTARTTGLSEEDRWRIVEHLARRPGAGDLIPGTGGARKVRLGGRGHGKRGGYRVITAFADRSTPVFLLAVFAKGDRVDLSTAERGELRHLLADLFKAYGTRGRGNEQGR